MKSAERHHLKENELANLTIQARHAIEARRSQVMGAVIAIAVVAVGVIGYLTWRGRVESRASVQFAEGVAIELARVGPPAADGSRSTSLSFLTEQERAEAALVKFKAAADDYPSTRAGVDARYREASTQLTLGHAKDAAQAYQQVIDRAGSGFLGQMARLGLAEANAREGQFDQAISIYNGLAQQKDDRLVETVLIQLGRVYRDAGKRAEAEQTFNRLINEYPASLLLEDARREIDILKEG